MDTINKIIENKVCGLCYNNRLILPFKAHFLKVIIENKIITDFSPSSKGIFIREKEDFTDIYFYDYKDLKNSVSEFEAIKIVLVEKGKDIFDFKNHLKLSLYLEDRHKVRIEECDDDIIFIE